MALTQPNVAQTVRVAVQPGHPYLVGHFYGPPTPVPMGMLSPAGDVATRQHQPQPAVGKSKARPLPPIASNGWEDSHKIDGRRDDQYQQQHDLLAWQSGPLVVVMKLILLIISLFVISLYAIQSKILSGGITRLLNIFSSKHLTTKVKTVYDLLSKSVTCLQ